MKDFSPSSLVSKFEESATLALSAKAKQLAAEGRSIINFGVGEPDFNTPKAIIDAAYQGALKGATKYTAVGGTPSARKAIAEAMSADYGINFSADEVVISNGGKQAIFHFMQAVLEPGDEVLIPAPYWVSFPEMVKIVGAKPVIVDCDWKTGQIDLQSLKQKITKKSRMVILCSPSNPSGAVYPAKALQEVLNLIESHPIWVMSDDTYYHLVFEPAKFHSVLQLNPKFRERSCLIGSASKTYSMTGWRLGWAIVPPVIAKAMVKLQSQVTSNPSSLSQIAIEEALKNQNAAAAEFKKIFQIRRDKALQCLEKIKGISWIPPDGAFYVFFRLQGLIEEPSVEAFCERLLMREGVCIIPGVAFGAPDFARLSYALDEAHIEEGITRLSKALKAK